ncbi:hypothetical protein NCCP2222_26980 [Sporosarcina sp. NCCP-2222]|nr:MULTISPECIES: cytochrome c oxidase subunit 2A [Sporosarcina]MCG3088211.1 cytochrome c oxidase subunit 2A [Sporosarcina cyprini]GKV56751.1 hypothetical protein NCCP2222_26980 [Sporosarcina sp. NCCP-2222]
MAKSTKQQLEPQHNPSINLKGTLIAVMLLGVFILATWFGCYYLFLSR